jgi:hypothetical protein
MMNKWLKEHCVVWSVWKTPQIAQNAELSKSVRIG